MSTHIMNPVRGKRIRITELDACGHPPTSGGTSIVSDGFITVTFTSEKEDGAEIIQKNAWGALCVNEKANDSFKRLSVEIEFCGVNPNLIAAVTNAKVYKDGPTGDVIGFTVGEGPIDGNFALELWLGLSGMACGAGEEGSVYMLLPYVGQGVLGDITVDGENAVTFSLTGAFTKGGNGWDTGPFKVVRNEEGVAAKLPVALDSLDHLLLIDTAEAPPAASSDPVPFPV
jgi:hypothetical protein